MMLPSRLGCPLSLKTPDMGNTGLDGSNTVGEKGLAVSDVTIRGLVINNFDVGISIGSNSVVEFNFIGVDPSGTVDLGNRLGIGVFGENNRIGGTGPGTGNLISGNDTGIWVGGTLGPSSMTTTIQGNLIGTNASGLGALGNREGIRLVYKQRRDHRRYRERSEHDFGQRYRHSDHAKLFGQSGHRELHRAQIHRNRRDRKRLWHYRFRV